MNEWRSLRSGWVLGICVVLFASNTAGASGQAGEEVSMKESTLIGNIPASTVGEAATAAVPAGDGHPVEGALPQPALPTGEAKQATRPLGGDALSPLPVATGEPVERHAQAFQPEAPIPIESQLPAEHKEPKANAVPRALPITAQSPAS